MTTTKLQFTSVELAALKLPGMPHTPQGIRRLAKAEGWAVTIEHGKGGRGGGRMLFTPREYVLALVAPDGCSAGSEAAHRPPVNGGGRRRVNAEASLDWIVEQAWSTSPTMPKAIHEHVQIVRDALRSLHVAQAQLSSLRSQHHHLGVSYREAAEKVNPLHCEIDRLEVALEKAEADLARAREAACPGT